MRRDARCRIDSLKVLAAAVAAAGALLASPPAEAARGGPDAGGWSWADSNEPLVGNSVEVMSPVTTLRTALADNEVVAVPLSFAFTLYGTTSWTAYLSSNGWFSLIDPAGDSAPGTSAIPTPGAPDAMIAYYWADLGGGATTMVQHGPTTNGHAIRAWHIDKRTGNRVRAFLQFYRSGMIRVLYEDVPGPGAATIGLEDGSGGAGTSILDRGTGSVAPRPGYAILFYPGSAPDCAVPSVLSCGIAAVGDTALGPNQSRSYGCASGAWDGRESVFTLSLTAPQSLDLVLSGTGGRGQALFLLRDTCDAALECLAGGTATLSMPVLGAGNYLIVVDGVGPADDGTFTLDAACNGVSTPLACGGITSTSPSGANRIASYSCRAGTFDAAETLHHFSLVSPQTVTLTISPATPFDVLLLDQRTLLPVASRCISGGDAGAGAYQLAAGDYVAVIDGPFGASGSVQLRLDCAPAPPITPIFCGQLGVPGSTAGPSLIDRYGCSTGVYPTGEAFYRFQPAARAIATAVPQGAVWNVFAMEEGDGPEDCIGTNSFGLAIANVTPPESYLFVVDSVTAAAPTSLSLTCAPLAPTTLTCGGTLSAFTGQTNQLRDYSCLRRALTGDESYFLFTNPVQQTFSVGVTNAMPSQDVDVAIFDGAFDVAQARCIAGGNRIATVQNAPPGEYMIVVDATAFQTNVAFDITLACGGSGLPCAAAPALACNSLISGDTTTGARSALGYLGVDQLYPGPELVYRFDNPVRQPINFLLRNAASPGMDLILLRACGDDSAIDWADTALIEPLLDPGTYYVVVDGRGGAAGAFELVTFCGDPYLDPPVLTAQVPAGACLHEEKRLYYPTTVPAGDIVFSFDLSGSMRTELDQVKQNAESIYREINQLVPSLQFGLASFVEYASPYNDTVCGVSHFPTASGPWPYRLHQPLTTDINQVSTVLQTINIVGGAKETYTHTFYQAHTDPNIGWRDCARKLWLDFGDEVPVDCNVMSCIGGALNTGRDPGPNGMTGDADDHILLTEIDGMAADGISLIHVDSSENATQIAMWDCLSRRTGGQAFVTDLLGNIPDGTDIVRGLTGVIKETLRSCPLVLLEPTGPYASWVTISPPSYGPLQTPFVGDFSIDFCVPPGTPPGDYSVPIQASCIGAGSCLTQIVGTQEVTLEVSSCVPPPTADAQALPGSVCVGTTITLDGSATTACPAGTGTMEYRWLDGLTEVCGWSTTPTCDVQPGVPTTYTLEVRCPLAPPPGCAASDTVLVTVDEPFAVAEPEPAICVGSIATLDGSGSQACVGGTLEYRWLDGLTEVCAWSATPTCAVIPPATTTYTLEVRCVGGPTPGCESDAQVTVTVEPEPVADAGPDTTVCEFRPATLTAAGSQTGACPGGVTYEWRLGAVVVRPASPDPTYTPPTTPPGPHVYTVIVRCVGGTACEALDVVTLTVDACALAVDFDHVTAVRSAAAAGVTVLFGTLKEDRTLGFVIERSAGAADGLFVALDPFIAAAGAGHPYTFVDAQAPAGPVFYRVVEYTDDGRGDVSPTVEAKAATGGRATAGRGRGRLRR